MDELTRRAMLGDREAQEEFTKQGKTLPCPYCGSEWTQVRRMGITALDSGYRGECDNCFAITKPFRTPEEAVAAWNRRPHIVVFCKECAKYKNGSCDVHSVYPDEYSSGYDFRPDDYDFCPYGEMEE